MIPVYKIETLTAAVLDHTITNEAANVYSKEVITDGIGHFMFTVPSGPIAGDYKFNDIALNDIVKIYLGYQSKPYSATPDFIGRVGKISGPLSSETGYLRIISGLSQGEILLRRFKKNKYYNAVGASTIVTEWANDLGIFGAGDITADATAVTLEVRTKNYFDLLQGISDYWFNAGNQIKKDFLVDVDGHLHWKTRPIRVAGVETLTVGDNIINYAVNRDIDAVKNDITVYGAAENFLPVDKDSYTEALAGWTATSGALTLQATPFGVGAWYIRCNNAGGNIVDFEYDLPHITIRDINKVCFWEWVAAFGAGTGYVDLFAPDNANYFRASAPKAGAWTFRERSLGPSQVYHVDENPNGIWTEVGTPNWWDIEKIRFYADFGGVGQSMFVDLMYFHPVRWTDNATDAASIVSYDQRDLEITDNNLHSDSDCQKRGEALLYQMKDAPTQITVTVPGNTNILVGDRLSMTIPAENISAANYDVITVEHSIASNGFTTKAVMVDSGNIRQPIALTSIRLLSDLNRYVRELANEIQRVK